MILPLLSVQETFRRSSSIFEITVNVLGVLGVLGLLGVIFFDICQIFVLF